MDGINVYLAIGIVFLLAAIFGGIEALGIKIPAPKRRNARLVFALVGIAAVVAAYVAPLPGTAAAKVAAYRDQVKSSCSEMRRIRAAGDDALPMNPKGQIDTVAMLDLFRRQSAQLDATLAALWEETTPRSLRADRAEAIELFAQSNELLVDILVHVEATLPRWASQAEVA